MPASTPASAPVRPSGSVEPSSRTTAALREQPHIDTVETWCRPLFDEAKAWRAIREAITGIENRTDMEIKLERKDGSVLICMSAPLPDGATMLTFQDITDTENVERALRESNEALEAAGQMKVDFVHHVSYELRAPLTTIIGYSELLERADAAGLTMAEVMLANEQARRSPEEVEAGLDRIHAAMEACIDRGLAQQGNLPGGLQVRRRARQVLESIKARAERAEAGLVASGGDERVSQREPGRHIQGVDGGHVHDDLDRARPACVRLDAHGGRHCLSI